MPRDSAATFTQLSDYVLILRRQWRVIVSVVVLGALAAGGFLVVAPREYTSATSILVTAATATTSSTSKAEEINLDTEAQLVVSTETVAAAAELLDVSAEDVTDLADRVSVTVPPNTEILTISFVGPTAKDAQDGARAFAQAYLDGRQESAEGTLDAEYEALQKRIDEVQTQLDAAIAAAKDADPGSAGRARLDAQAAALNNQLAALGSQQNQIRSSAVSPGRIVTQAGLPTSPTSPRVPLTVLAGLLAGLLAGIALATLRFRRDDRIYTAADLERRTDLTVAAVLTGPLQVGEVTVVPPSGPDGRTYARLRNLAMTGLERSSRRVVLVTSTHRGAGSVAANLAASLVRAGEDVCLVCADAFADTAEQLLGGNPSAGLADVLAGTRPVGDVVRTVPDLPGLRLVGPGRDADRADALLQTRGMRAAIDRLLESASYVVIEAPATSEGTGAQSLAAAAELALLVVETGTTTARDVDDALLQFESMHRPVLGAVVARYLRDDRAGRSKAPAVRRGGEPPAPRSPEPATPSVNGNRPGLAPTGPGTAPR